jgi:hypothetical protein
LTTIPAVKVLYIAGSGRSGSTLLTQILDQVDGVTGSGELRFLWERGLLEDRLCGCGKHFSHCPVWKAVIDEAFGGPRGVDAQAAVADLAGPSRVRRLPRLLLAARRGRAGPGLGPDQVARLQRLYQAIPAVTGAAVVVDSSKLPPYGQLLHQVAGIELYVVHLVRDPRAAAFSWTRKKALPDRGEGAVMASQGVGRSAVLWTIWNGTTELLWGRHGNRYLRLRYEDLVADLRGSVAQVLDLVGLGVGDDSFLGAGTVTLGVTHSVAGNPGRLVHGSVPVRLDDEWARKMPRRDKALVTALTWPLLLRYRYPLRAVPGKVSAGVSG